MSKRYVQVPISYLEPIFEDWKEGFEKGNFLNVFFMPFGDILFRALQFSDWMNETKNQTVRIINFETELIVNPENLDELLNKYSGENLILLAKRAFMRPDANAMVGVLEKWYAREGKGALIFHEGYPSEISYFVPKPVMTQSQMIHACYPQGVMKQYTLTTAELFRVKIDSELTDSIVKQCGGIPWLVNDVLRRVGEDNLFENESLLWKVEQIAKSIPQLSGIEKDLVKYGLKNKHGEWIPVFQRYFDNAAKDKLQIQDDRVTYDDRDYSNVFSAGEYRILKYLCGREGVVSREELGRQFWKQLDASEYSDWALDAVMSRLRKKLVRTRIPFSIKTRRGRGYEHI